MDEMEELDLLRAKNEEEMDRCLGFFKSDMKKTGLTESQMKQCELYASEYLYDYLVYNDYESSYSMDDGVRMVECYVKFRLIHQYGIHGLEIKWRCQAIRMFYTSMAVRGLVDKEEFEYMCEEMDDELEDWMHGHTSLDFDFY